jgi:hypothetical protein
MIQALADAPALPLARAPMKLLLGTCGGYHIGCAIGSVDVIEDQLEVNGQ